ncbi:hypothetical protein [Nonomuraea sp. NPDC049607]|uniref:hypothetical protein n=1 Tax=unclassified Nonomuraea TaxID=2593643 RepID=UPI003443538F
MSIRVRLDDLCQETWEAVAELRVADDQADLIASNLYSMAEGRSLPGFVTRAVMHDERAVGSQHRYVERVSAPGRWTACSSS